MIIGLAGAARSGKDTAAERLVRRGFLKYAFAWPLKGACETLFGLSPDQVHGSRKDVVDHRYGATPRSILVAVGTCARGVAPAVFVDAFLRWRRMHADRDVVISDVRFQNEIDAIHALGGRVYLVRRHVPGGPEPEPTHLRVDGVLDNDGAIEDLHAATDALL